MRKEAFGTNATEPTKPYWWESIDPNKKVGVYIAANVKRDDSLEPSEQLNVTRTAAQNVVEFIKNQERPADFVTDALSVGGVFSQIFPEDCTALMESGLAKKIDPDPPEKEIA